MGPVPMFELIPYQRFRDTPAVRFFDVTVADSNARDLVVHSGPAVSPPDDQESGAWQFYLHPHQEDNLATSLNRSKRPRKSRSFGSRAHAFVASRLVARLYSKSTARAEKRPPNGRPFLLWGGKGAGF